MEPAINIKFLALPKNERRQLAQFFRKLLKFFIENEIVAVATAGTLLGLTRHGDIMAHDEDIDMLIDRTNLKKLQDLFVDDKFIFKDGTSKITFKLTKTRKDQYDIHSQERHRIEWPFVDLFVGDMGTYTEKAFTLKNNSNRPVLVNIQVSYHFILKLF